MTDDFPTIEELRAAIESVEQVIEDRTRRMARLNESIKELEARRDRLARELREMTERKAVRA